MKRTVSFWQMIGFIFTGITGTLLHFLYNWSGQNPVIGAFSAVNESIWEHMKLLFFPLFLFAVAEYFVIGKAYRNFWCVKATGTAFGLFLIPALYYTYTGSLGIQIDLINISIFFIAAAAVCWLEARLLRRSVPECRFPKAAFAFLILLGVVFVILTFEPPALPLFQPPEKI